jgi:hypothetical protein
VATVLFSASWRDLQEDQFNFFTAHARRFIGLIPQFVSRREIWPLPHHFSDFLCRGDGKLKQPFGREQEKWLRPGEILFCKSIDVF